MRKTTCNGNKKPAAQGSGPYDHANEVQANSTLNRIAPQIGAMTGI